MPIEREILRSCVLEALKSKPGTQFENLKYDVGAEAAKRGLAVDSAGGSQAILQRPDWRTLREVIWELISERVLVVGMDDSNESWPFLSLTTYGEDYVRNQRATPHDRSDYLSRVLASGPADDVEQRYVTQALEAFARDLPDAAAVMIGAAAEHELIRLVTAIAAKDPAESATATAALDQPALKMLRFAESYFNSRQAKLPRRLRETFGTTFMSVAQVIRQTRNDGGHPTLPAVDRQQVFVVLQLYPEYRAWLREVEPLLPL